MELQALGTISGSIGTPGVWTLTLPGSQTIDTTKLITATAATENAIPLLGSHFAFSDDSATSDIRNAGYCAYNSSTTICAIGITFAQASSNFSEIVDNGTVPTTAAGDFVLATALIPITGWQP